MCRVSLESVAYRKCRCETKQTALIEADTVIPHCDSDLRLEVDGQLEREPECIFETHLTLYCDAGAMEQSEGYTGTCIETPFAPVCPVRLGYHEVICSRDIKSHETE